MVSFVGKAHWGLMILTIRCVISLVFWGLYFIYAIFVLQPFSANLVFTRASTHAMGTMQIKLGFVEAPQTNWLMDFNEVYAELVRHSKPSLISAPPVRLSPSLRSSFADSFARGNRLKAYVPSAHTKQDPNSKTTAGSALTRVRK